MYCSLCRHVIRAKARAKAQGIHEEVTSTELDWVMFGMNQSILISDDNQPEDEQELRKHTDVEPDPYVRAIRSEINPALMRAWLAECEQTHGPTCSAATLSTVSPSATLLLVDVEQQCLVDASFDTRFVALSYVWGAATQFLTLRSNLAALQQPGALAHRPLPATIRDAMALVARLHESHLWVDTLCIVQDDLANKRAQIAQMASIYNRALLTLVALSGASASAGLPGLSSPRLAAAAVRLAPGLRLAPREGPTAAFEASVYDSRAWTFQERILARRALFFLPGQVFWQCRAATWAEDRRGDVADDWPSASVTVAKIEGWAAARRAASERSAGASGFGGEDDFACYAQLVREYARKRMGFVGDVVDAFTGVTAALGVLFGWGFVVGVPRGLVGLALLWTPLEAVVRRRSGEGEAVVFPSWAWAGWVGEVHYGDFVQRLPQIPLAECYRSCVELFEFGGREGGSEGGGQGSSDVLRFMTCGVPAAAFRIERVEGRLQNVDAGTLVCRDVHRLFDDAGRCCGIVYGLSEQDESRLQEMQLVLLSKLARVNSLNFYGPTVSLYDLDKPTTTEPLFDRALSDREWCTLNVLMVEWKGEFASRVGIGQVHVDAWNRVPRQEMPVLLA
ncbi:heterokaryon incompatibility protein-domain-containing protein [Neofusicoccum parvum]|nr:heterokaryon incompatibility protein-domain-containing protein [Neofusicoccum parvum]